MNLDVASFGAILQNTMKKKLKYGLTKLFNKVILLG